MKFCLKKDINKKYLKLIKIELIELPLNKFLAILKIKKR